MSNYLVRVWLEQALKANHGRATIVQVCKHIWVNHELELRAAGDAFYTWQYRVRWAATQLRKAGIMRPVKESPRGVWELKQF